MRTPREQLERRAGNMLRPLGRDGVNMLVRAFTRKKIEKIGEGLRVWLESLPIKDEQPNFNAIGDPKEVEKRWAEEMCLTPENHLQQLVDYLDEMRKADPASS